MFHDIDPTMQVRELLADAGLSAGMVSWLSTVVMVFIVLLMAWLSKIITTAILNRSVTLWVKRTESIYDDKLVESRMFYRLSWIVPCLVVWFTASWALKENLFWLTFVHSTAEIYIVLCVVLTVIAFVDGWYSIYQMKPVYEGRSIKGYVQLAQILVVFIGFLIIISILFRAFMLEYLRNHKNIDEELPIIVRDMAPSETGMPVELYCFSKINQWVPY